MAPMHLIGPHFLLCTSIEVLYQCFSLSIFTNKKLSTNFNMMPILGRILSLLESFQTILHFYLMCRICKVYYLIFDLLHRNIGCFVLLSRNKVSLILSFHLRQLFNLIHSWQTQEANEGHFVAIGKIYNLNLQKLADSHFSWFYRRANFSFQVDLHSLFEIEFEEIAAVAN